MEEEGGGENSIGVYKQKMLFLLVKQTLLRNV